jgi:hypothetical protein
MTDDRILRRLSAMTDTLRVILEVGKKPRVVASERRTT